ncbi:MAG: Crp/Fnr family transcriptional regulator [Candidatus Aminicenantia bacterium]
MREDFLSTISLFRELNREEITEILHIGRVRELKKDTVIFEEGDKSDSLYIIYEGKVRISKMIPNAGEEALAILEEGNYFGEMSLIEDSFRSAWAIAHSDVVLLEISLQDFRELMDKNKDLSIKVLKSFVKELSNKLREANEKISAIFALTNWIT